MKQEMQGNIISAEITPTPNKSQEAALALQRLGFRILHIGKTISVEAPESLWNSTFNVYFETRKKNILPGIEGGETAYRKAITDKMVIPSHLKGLVSDIQFVEPPEFY